MLERKSPCFSSSHSPPGCCMAFPTVSASLACRAAGAEVLQDGPPVLVLSFHTGWSSPQLHFPSCGEVLLEAKHEELICEWETLPCEGAPALRRFFISRGCRCLVSRRTSSRCLLRLCKLWVNFYGDAIFSFMCLSKGRGCSLHCIRMYLSTLKICCSFGGREHYIRSIIMFSPSFGHFFWSL